MEKIRKIELSEIQRVKEKVVKLSPAEKDKILAALILTTDRIAGILKSMIDADADLSKKEKDKIQDEIEEAVSIGPRWLNYSYKLKKKKSNGPKI